MNELKQLKTISRQTCDGHTYAILLALDIYDPTTAREFLEQVLEKFKMHWMIGPPQTTHLLVTLMGDLSAPQFVALCQEKMDTDPILRAIVSRLKVADVWRGASSGAMLEQETLLM
ncbi:MAG: hypothetical protein HUU38_20265 [Anaerolineales bacterium]|nr:hypothetical protein [Anaerolineales bacterium]